MTTTVDQWMTREEWAVAVRTPYSDRFDNIEVSDKASDYATPDEITAAITALRQLWCDLGRQAKQLGPSPLDQRRGETILDWMARREAAPDIEREHWEQLGLLRQRRRFVNETRRNLERDLMPWRNLRAIEAPAAIALFERREAAFQSANEQRRREIETTPIDDDAWAKACALEQRRRDNRAAALQAMSQWHR